MRINEIFLKYHVGYKDSVDVEDKSDAWGKVVFGKSSEKAPDAVKKHFDRQSAMAQNKEYQAAKKKWLRFFEQVAKRDLSP